MRCPRNEVQISLDRDVPWEQSQSGEQFRDGDSHRQLLFFTVDRYVDHLQRFQRHVARSSAFRESTAAAAIWSSTAVSTATDTDGQT
jgi:hypothetical protein